MGKCSGKVHGESSVGKFGGNVRLERSAGKFRGNVPWESSGGNFGGREVRRKILVGKFGCLIYLFNCFNESSIILVLCIDTV